MKPQNVIIVNEAKGNVNLYHVRVDVGGVPLWTGVYAETIERANRVVEKLFGKGKVKGRPVKVKESKDSKGPKNKVEKGSQKRYKNPLATDDPEKYIGKWEAYDEPQGINSKTGQKMVHAEAAEEVVLDDSVQEGTLGPEFSHGLTNSSTGRGAVPTETPFEPKDLPNVLRPRKKQPGAKAPTRKVEKTVSKSLTDKVRKPNAKVTEMEAPTRLDELFGRG